MFDLERRSVHGCLMYGDRFFLGILSAASLLSSVAPARAQGAEPAAVSAQQSAPNVSAAAHPAPAPAASPGVVLDYSGNSREFRRKQLQEERAGLSLGGPIAVTAIGGVVLLAGGVSYMIGTMIHADCVFDTTCQHKGWLYAGVPLMLVGATTAALGGIWLGVRTSNRQRLDREIEALAWETRGPQLSVGMMPRALGGTLQARLSF